MKENQLTQYRKEYKDYLDKTGRTRISGNEWVGKTSARKLNKSQKDDIIIKEIRHISGKKNAKIELNYDIPKDINNFQFDAKHINEERNHKVTKKEAISFIKNSKLKMTVWQGRYENYYSDEGASYVDTKEKIIRTSFHSDEYDEKTKKYLEVINNGRKDK